MKSLPLDLVKELESLDYPTTIQSFSKDIKSLPTPLSGELWMPIQGFDWHYYVSNMGRVLSLKLYARAGLTGKLLTPANSGKFANYPQVVLYRPDGTKWRPKVHRLVAEYFIPNPNKLPQINHLNHITTDNTAENLEWCDNARNKQWESELSEQDVREIRALYAQHVMLGDLPIEKFCKIISAKKGMTKNNIRHIVTWISWKSISPENFTTSQLEELTQFWLS